MSNIWIQADQIPVTPAFTEFNDNSVDTTGLAKLHKERSITTSNNRTYTLATNPNDLSNIIFNTNIADVQNLSNVLAAP